MIAGHLALYTFGVFRQPSENPATKGFHDRNDPIFEVVDRSEGLVARSGYDGEPGPASWGVQIYPRFFIDQGDGWSPSTLSLWKDFGSVLAFSYAGLHAEALKHGREWFMTPTWPPYVLWWVEEGSIPLWREAVLRHEHLHDHGPTSFAFDFKRPFDAAGNPIQIPKLSAALRRSSPAEG